MTKFLTRDCSCTHRTYNGQKRPDECPHGNRYLTEAEAKPKVRKPLARKSPRRQAEEEAGTRPRRRSTLKQGKGFQASRAQRDKVRGLPCLGCRQEIPVDPAHIWPQGKGGCDHSDCVIPLCRTCHRSFDEGKLELLERLAGTEAWAEEQAHPILVHGVSPVELVRRLSGGAYEFVKRSDLPLSNHNERNRDA